MRCFGLLWYIYHHTHLFSTLPSPDVAQKYYKKNCAPGSVAMVPTLPVTLPLVFSTAAAVRGSDSCF